MDALLDYLDEIEEVLDSSRRVPLSSNVSVNKSKIVEIITDIRLNLPKDITAAQRIFSDSDKILADANHRAEKIIDQAEAEANMMKNAHEISRRAQEHAAEITEEAKKKARELRHDAAEYVDGKLALAEKQMKAYIANLEEQHKQIIDYFNEMLDVLYENRQELRR